jgi:hypothetical protein
MDTKPKMVVTVTDYSILHRLVCDAYIEAQTAAAEARVRGGDPIREKFLAERAEALTRLREEVQQAHTFR